MFTEKVIYNLPVLKCYFKKWQCVKKKFDMNLLTFSLKKLCRCPCGIYVEGKIILMK